MTKSNGFRDLEVYRLSVSFAVDIYKLLEKFPKDERFGLIDQMKRASASVGANIAEGYGRYSKKEFVNYLYISRGSLMEVLHFLNLSKELKYITEDDYESLEQMVNVLGVKINNLVNAIKNKQEQ